MKRITQIIFVRLRQVFARCAKLFSDPVSGAVGISLPVLAVLALPIVSFVAIHAVANPSGQRGIVGGPEIHAPIIGNINEASVVNQTSPGAEAGSIRAEEKAAVLGSALFAAGAVPLFDTLPSRDGIYTYTVQEGDALSSIAARFGILLDTIYWNNDLSSSVIRPGDRLRILPVNGVAHEVEEGETIYDIASRYGVDSAAISDLNGVRGVLSPGATLIVPGGKKNTAAPALRSAVSLPHYPGYYVLPAEGWNWGRLHGHNAIDIANSCGTPVMAAADGVVAEVVSSGWNHGYGKYVIIEHINGTETAYAHLQSIDVSVGTIVSQKQKIGTIGNTGNTHGPTGCHLHFEVHGARNPFVR